MKNNSSAFCSERAWEPYLQLIMVPILVTFGLLGNIISFIVMLSPVYRRKSYGYYLRALAVFDSLTLITSLILIVNDGVFALNRKRQDELNASVYAGVMFYHTSGTCKLSEFLRHVIYLMSSWLVVCFTADRFIAVCYPLLRARYCTEKAAIHTIIALFITIMISQIYHLVYVEKLSRTVNHHMPCHAHTAYRHVYFGLNYFWFSFLLRFALPFIAITFCNGFIIYHIQRRGKRLATYNHKTNLAICTLYAICACFIFTLLPNAIITMIQFIAFFINTRLIDQHLYCTLRMVYTPFEVLRLVNYSTNCVLYGLTGRQFRREFHKLFVQCAGKRFFESRNPNILDPIVLRQQGLLSDRKYTFRAIWK